LGNYYIYTEIKKKMSWAYSSVLQYLSSMDAKFQPHNCKKKKKIRGVCVHIIRWKKKESQAWWVMPVIPATRRLKQEDCELRAAWAT
jgi:hypothetical protein